MLDYAIDIRKQLHPTLEVPDTLKNRRAQVVAELTELQNEVDLVSKLMSNDELMKTMETMRDPKALLNHLTKDYDVSFDRYK
jgi:translation initiation factor 3 subunit E